MEDWIDWRRLIAEFKRFLNPTEKTVNRKLSLCSDHVNEGVHKLYRKIFTSRQKQFVTRAKLNNSFQRYSNVFTVTLFSQWSVRCHKCVLISFVTTSVCLRRNKRRSTAQIRYHPEDVFPFDTCNLFWNVPYKSPTQQKKPHSRVAGRRRRTQFECL